MGDLTRLDFVKSSAGAAAGITVIGTLVTTQVAEADAGPVGSEPVVAYVKNPKSGEITVMRGDREVVIHDVQLAAKIARAAR